MFALCLFCFPCQNFALYCSKHLAQASRALEQKGYCTLCCSELVKSAIEPSLSKLRPHEPPDQRLEQSRMIARLLFVHPWRVLNLANLLAWRQIFLQEQYKIPLLIICKLDVFHNQKKCLVSFSMSENPQMLRAWLSCLTRDPPMVSFNNSLQIKWWFSPSWLREIDETKKPSSPQRGKKQKIHTHTHPSSCNLVYMLILQLHNTCESQMTHSLIVLGLILKGWNL